MGQYIHLNKGISDIMFLLIEVLDFCAGKGTKTIFINNIVKNLSNITVYDKSDERLKVLKNRIKIKINRNTSLVKDSQGVNGMASPKHPQSVTLL